MKKIMFLTGLMILIISVNAISSYDAINFLKNENNYLLEQETPEEPVNPIEINESKYWVIPITINDSILTFFVIEFNEKKLSEKKTDARKAISTAFFLRELIKLRERFSDSTNNEWIISSKHLTSFNSLNQIISNEVFELNLIKTEMNSSEITSKVIKVQNELNLINSITINSAEAINSALTKENGFISNPSEKTKNELIQEYELVFNEIKSLMNKVTDYALAVNELKQSISLSSHPNAAVNIQRANSPTSFLNISNYFNDSEAMKSNIESINSDILLKVDSFMQINESREKRNNTFSILYYEDLEIKNKTGKNYSIKQLTEIVLTENNIWNDALKLQDVENNWKQAEKYFSQEKYELAEQSALRAKKDAIQIFNSGIYTPKKQELLSIENTAIAVGILIALLAVIYIANNKEKFFKKEEGNKNELY
jgi:hypothetical protein